MRFSIATQAADGDLLSEEELLEEAKAIVADLVAEHAYVLRVDGKAIGCDDETMPGLTEERARVLFKSLVDAAENNTGTFVSQLRFQDFGVFKRNPSTGQYEEVRGMFHKGVSARRKNGFGRARWVR